MAKKIVLAPDRIVRLAKLQIELQAQVTQKEEELLLAKIKLKEVSEHSLPDAMEQAGLNHTSTPDGIEVRLKSDVFASVTEETAPKVATWLKEIGESGLIRNDMTIVLGPGSDNAAGQIEALAKEMGVDCARKEYVNTASLKALMRHRLKAGLDVPLRDLGATRVIHTEVKKKETI